MAKKLNEGAYLQLREHDPAFQAMSRIVDTSNVYDINQRFIKNIELGINNFTPILEKWYNNSGLLSDGKYINKTKFFTTAETVTNSAGNKSIKSKTVKYFKFKTNMSLKVTSNSKLKNCIISKTNDENIYKIDTKIDDEGNIIYYENLETTGSNTDKTSESYGKIVKTVAVDSSPLVRNDKLMINELPAFFIYLNGIKIPDNEIFLYANNSWTDVFIPMDYIGDIEGFVDNLDCDFHIDIRQAGSEDFYTRIQNFGGSSINIDLSSDDYKYSRYDKFTVTSDKIVLFVDGKIERIKSVEYTNTDDKKHINIQFDKIYDNKDLEIYILNDIIYRYKKPESSMINTLGNKLHFFIDDDYKTDIISGPITKQSIAFFYEGMRIDDSKIVQTSRFSFEYEISDKDTFDESKIEFFIEDMNWYIEDNKYTTYGDDYYLLNMLGVKRCVDKMKGNLSYSVFDQSPYDIGFKATLSKSGNKFDVSKTIKYYDNLEKHYPSDETKALKMISDNPSILRPLFTDNFTVKSKKMFIVGNTKDVKITSVFKYDIDVYTMFYKLCLNRLVLDTTLYDQIYEKDKDLITIPKSCLSEGINVIELFQYDLTYSENSIYSDNVYNGFDEVINTDGTKVWQKHYNFADLPFGNIFISDDLCAIEQVKQKWFTDSSPEYFLVYPNKVDNSGYRMVNKFEILSKNDEGMTIQIKLCDQELNHTKGRFFLLIKTYNMIEEILHTNEDGSYMAENDLIFPVYNSYIEYDYTNALDKYGNVIKIKNGVKEIFEYIPYINSSEPIITRNGEELIYGKEYTFINPEKNDSVACSYIILKTQTKENDVIRCQFNSTYSNILILGYTGLNIDNLYGLIYLSELKYPVSTEYMNIIVNGKKLSAYDVDILSDKLIRVKNITRPITTLLITTNLTCKEIELNDYVNAYKESAFELVLETIFTNCDPSKFKETIKPSINYTYKVNEELNPEIYLYNHGFIPTVDSVLQMENPLENDDTIVYTTDTTKIMFLNWFLKSGKTKSICYPGIDLKEVVLKYFSIYENDLVDNRLDIFIDSGRFYEGIPENICNDLFYYDKTTGKSSVMYPGVDNNIRRRYFFSMLKEVISTKSLEEDGTSVDWMEELKNHKGSKILYPGDFPLEPDKNGIMFTGFNHDITVFPDKEI